MATKVYGYLDFSVNFNSDLTILTGANGCGKTTILRLIHALLTPNFKEIICIPFAYIDLEIDDSNKRLHITCAELDSDTVRLSISDINDSGLILPRFGGDKQQYFQTGLDTSPEFFDELLINNSRHAVVMRIAQIPSPVFLGLDRRRESNLDRQHRDSAQVRWLNSNTSKRAARESRMLRGTTVASLMEAEYLVQEAFRRIREFEDRQASVLRDNILLSAFKYSDMKHGSSVGRGLFNWQEKAHVRARRAKIYDALSKLGISNSKLKDQIEEFFDRLDQLFGQLATQKDGAVSIEWLINWTQVERIEGIMDAIDRHEEILSKKYAPINRLKDTIDKFFSDSGKRLVVDPVGHLSVIKPNNEATTIDALSSGERQIVVIFAHAILDEDKHRGSIFVIDEPELSLHIRWQRIFADEIQKVGPKTQFIMATHSPDIIGENKMKCKGLRG